MLYHIWQIKYYNDTEDDDDNDVMRCQEMSRHQEDIGGKKNFYWRKLSLVGTWKFDF